MGGRNASQKFREKYKSIPLKPMMPKEYGIEKRKELKRFEQSIMKASADNIGKEPGE